MQEALISVIVPIYNVEKYLNRCIESIVNQTYHNIEIILVDDGSTDCCPQICDEWMKKDKRIKVIHKKNAGLGMARNTGIENASGDFICFFDSDDYVALDTLYKVNALQKKYSAEVVCFGFNSVNKDGVIKTSKIPNPPKLFYKGKEVQDLFLPNLISFDTRTGEDWKLTMSACMTLISMKLVKENNWRFVSERKIISEDIYSLLELYKYVKMVAILPEALYFYCENQNSLTRTYRKGRYENIKQFYYECLKLWEKSEFNNNVKERLSEPFFANTIAAMKQIVKADEKYGVKIAELKNIVNDEVLNSTIKAKNINRESFNRKLLFWCMAHKLYYLCYVLCKLKQ